MKCWLKVLTVVSLVASCVVSQGQENERSLAGRAADRVLSSDEFRGQEDQGLFAEWLESFVEWLNGLFGETQNPFSGMGSVLAPVFMAIIIAAILILVAWIVSIMIGRRRSPERILNFAEERLAPPHELIRMAESAANQGDYSRAFTLAYWAFLKLADAAGHLHYSDNATNWEIIATVKAEVPPELAKEARMHAGTFDEIEYGNGKATVEQYYAVCTLTESMEKVRAAA